MNYLRKSTEGYHIGGVLLDFAGGVLSLLQMDIYCFIEHSNTQLTGNIPKMALAVATLLFNIILITQHYILYMGNRIPELVRNSSDEEQRLIDSTERNRLYTINVEPDDLQVRTSDDNRKV